MAVGSHGLLGKQNVYEHSMGAPLVFSGPGVPRGEESNAFAYLLDIFPTLCTMLGIEVPTGLAGRDLSPIWRGESESVRDSLFTSFRDLMKSVRDDRWKLIRYPKIDHVQLFDLAEDPHETRNLADDPAQADRIAALTDTMREWQRTVGDDHPLSISDPQPKEIDMTGRKQNRDRWQPAWIFEKYFERPYGKILSR